ncbi:cholesteryl ester transfer protein isoform X2 [Antennarius striatus]|uniref:cholesteryl ester transfer protein isoform X2 n=1 Tax=Antennarius striatus TaxID=241820 RepID=UPI0035B3CABF
MSHAVFSELLLLLTLWGFGASYACLQDPALAYRLSGAVCRLTYPAAVVLNEKTTKVIEAAFQHARYPRVKGEKSIMFIGSIKYDLDNLEIQSLSIGRSEFDLHPGKGIAMEISNVSVVFKGTVQYEYSNWVVNISDSVNFEISSNVDLGINPKLYCGAGKVAADTSDCYLNFHELHLHLQGDKEPNWLKKVFTDFITFTVKMAVKAQICKEINKVANILADFIQDTAEQFLTDGDISVDIGLTAPPVITANYIESYHKGLTRYKNTTAVISKSVFHPSQLSENRMLYFWLSDELFNPMLAAAHHDGRFQLNISGAELSEPLKKKLSSAPPEFIRKCLLESGSPELRVWSSSVPHLNTSTSGTTVWTKASGNLYCESQSIPILFFETVVVVTVTASYADKKLFLHGISSQISVEKAELPLRNQLTQLEFIREAVEKIGIPKVLSVLEVELTRLLDKQGANLFDILNPDILPRDGFVSIELDFGFPHHLLVEFLKKTLQ